MKRVYSDNYPSAVVPVGNGSNLYHWDIREEKIEMEGRTSTQYSCLEATVFEPVSYGKLVSAMVAVAYTTEDELAMARQCCSSIEEYREYNAFVEECKKVAAEMLGLAYHPTYAPTQAEVMTQVRTLLKSTVEQLPEAEAEKVPALHDPWKPGEAVAKGNRRYNTRDGKAYECIQPHTTQEGWEPDLTPAMWKVVHYEEWPEIPETIPSENPWMLGQKGTWKGEHYICKMDNCVWNPDQYPQAWERV